MMQKEAYKTAGQKNGEQNKACCIGSRVKPVCSKTKSDHFTINSIDWGQHMDISKQEQDKQKNSKWKHFSVHWDW